MEFRSGILEFKKDFLKKINHSLKRLGAIVCWKLGAHPEEEVVDAFGNRRILKRVPREKGGYTRYHLTNEQHPNHTVEVIVLQEYLKERGIVFKKKQVVSAAM
ncbi:hypothetical protein MO973_06680 [Paenibacillus sp. TRM 82003]|nr:hypothetical protein [Paenibacillus sp. TRM 82003]